MKNDIIETITNFLGYEPENENIQKHSDTNYSIFYNGTKLKYALLLDLDNKILSVSGDIDFPFDFSSLFEISVEWDRISIEYEPQFYTDQKILVCRKDYENKNNFKTIMIVKWRNGELSVWPNLHKCKDINMN
jgi:hypothetical protein